VGLTRSPLDRPLDVFSGKIRFLRVLNRQMQTHVRVGVGPALSRGDRQLPREFGEQLAALRVISGLLVLDLCPLAVTRHVAPSLCSCRYSNGRSPVRAASI